MMYHTLECVAWREALQRPAKLCEQDLAGRGLDLDTEGDAIDGDRRLVVHRKHAGKCLAELDGAKGCRESEELGCMGEVAEGLWMPG